MNRVGEHIRFGVWFTGVGYILLWLLNASSDGAALHLSPGLHLAGMTSSAFVLICLVTRPLRRKRARAAPPAAHYTPEALVRLRLGKKNVPPPPRRYVQPRSHFGLRGGPH